MYTAARTEALDEASYCSLRTRPAPARARANTHTALLHSPTAQRPAQSRRTNARRDSTRIRTRRNAGPALYFCLLPMNAKIDMLPFA